MATIRQIVDKAVELKEAQVVLEALQDDKSRAQTRLAEVNAAIATQQPIVQSLADELKVMVNG
jgi:hypothetical protein